MTSTGVVVVDTTPFNYLILIGRADLIPTLPLPGRLNPRKPVAKILFALRVRPLWQESLEKPKHVKGSPKDLR